MTERVYVVTHLEMGWDCVTAVYRSYESAVRHCFCDQDERPLDELIELIEDGSTMYVITDKPLED